MLLVVADTTVLSNFAQVRGHTLLQQAFPSLGAPSAVREELAVGEKLGRVPACDWSWLAHVGLTDGEEARASELERFLQAGEAACLALAEARQGLLLTDDGRARRLAGDLNVQISGTIGALVRLVHREVLSPSQGDALLSDMMSRGYRSPVRSLGELLPSG